MTDPEFDNIPSWHNTCKWPHPENYVVWTDGAWHCNACGYSYGSTPLPYFLRKPKEEDKPC